LVQFLTKNRGRFICAKVREMPHSIMQNCIIFELGHTPK